MHLDIQTAGLELNRAHLDLMENQALASSKKANEGGYGETIVKVLAVIGALFLILAALATPEPLTILVVVPLAIASCTVLVKYAKPVSDFFVTLAILRLFSRSKTHHHHHFNSGSRYYGGGSRYYSNGGHNLGGGGGFVPSGPNHRSAASFRAQGNSGGSSPMSQSWSPSGSASPSSFGGGGSTFGAGGQSHAAYGGGHSSGPYTMGAGGGTQTAFGGGHDRQPTSTRDGNVGFGSRT